MDKTAFATTVNSVSAHDEMSANGIHEALHAAVALHQAGNLAEAAKQYCAILETFPDQVDALNLLGVIAQQNGEIDKALSLFDQAMIAGPNLAVLPFNKGNALRDVNRNDEAIALYKAALDIDPDYAEARLNLGVLLHDRGDTEAAIAQFNMLLRGAPDNAKAYYNLGQCRQTQGRFEDAEKALRKAIEIDPHDPHSHFTMASVLTEMEMYEDAILHIKNATTLKPDWKEAVSAHGLILGRSGDHKGAVKLCQSAIDSDPTNILLRFNLSSLHYQVGDVDVAKGMLSDALKICDASENEILNLVLRALRDLDPWIAITLLDQPLKHMRSANALHYVGSIFDSLDLKSVALTFYDEAIEADPTKAPLFESRGKLRLSIGEIEEGWSDLKRALDLKEELSKNPRGLNIWAGEDLESKAIILKLNGGIGDQVLFSTLLPDLISKAELCIVECAKRLIPVLKRTYPAAKVTDWLDPIAKRENRKMANYISPEVNAARYLRPDIASFSKKHVSLKPDKDLANRLRKKYEAAAKGRKIVGLSWLSGSQKNGVHKTLELKPLLQQFDPEELLFVSLQYGPVSSQIDKISREIGVTILEDETVDQLYNIDHFFAQASAMDLVISISNTAAHVSGSLGVPTWLLLPRGMGAFYFWFLDRTDSPWYPSIRIFRQRSITTLNQPWWSEVLDEMSEALRNWIKGPQTPRLKS